MEIAFYKNLSVEEFNQSRYQKVKICDTESGTAYWGFANCGLDGNKNFSLINESCIWIQKQNEDTYKAYIVKSTINMHETDYKDCLRTVCETLLNNIIN